MAKNSDKDKQLAFDISKGNQLILIESKTMRDDYVFKDDVLEKVKIVPQLPLSVEITVEMAATYYEVSVETIQSILKRHRPEFNEYGELRLLKGKALADFKTLVQGEQAFKGVNSLNLISRRGLLRLGMLLTESEIAQSIRHYLLNIEEISTDEQKMWAVEREISKRERRRLTDSIQSFYEGSLKGKGFEYSTFTNLVYKTLWDTNATGLRELYGLSKGDIIRDNLSTEDLKKVVDVETAISSLIRLDKDYDEIKTELTARRENFR